MTKGKKWLLKSLALSPHCMTRFMTCLCLVHPYRSDSGPGSCFAKLPKDAHVQLRMGHTGLNGEAEGGREEQNANSREERRACILHSLLLL